MKLRLQLCALAAALVAGCRRILQPDAVVLANASTVSAPSARDTKLTDAAIGRRRLVKLGTDEDHIDVCGTGNIPLGMTEEDSASAAAQRVAFRHFGLGDGGAIGVASGAIAAGDMLVAGAAGAVRTLPAGAGTYYLIGRATEAAADGADVPFVPCFPIQRVV